MGLFDNRKQGNGKNFVPVWFMRQAGRYHSHYQNIKKDSDFDTMCKNPKLACEITMGPINDFDFDAAILFSDLLYPLEQLNMGLSYKSGPPTLEKKITSLENLKELSILKNGYEFYTFQKEALELLKNELPKEKTLLGFVGAPFTLYSYAVEGGHSGNLIDAKKGLYDGRFDGFSEVLLPELLKNIEVQIEGGADAICLFDTAVGELSLFDFKRFSLPKLKFVTKEIKAKYPNTKIVYYSKLTNLDYLHAIEDENIDVLGVDWRLNLSRVIDELSTNYMIQGNIDPSWLHLPWSNLENNLNEFWSSLNPVKSKLDRWIMGLGHGVLQHTPEYNVKNAVKFIHENFYY